MKEPVWRTFWSAAIFVGGMMTMWVVLFSIYTECDGGFVYPGVNAPWYCGLEKLQRESTFSSVLEWLIILGIPAAMTLLFRLLIKPKQAKSKK